MLFDLHFCFGVVAAARFPLHAIRDPVALAVLAGITSFALCVGLFPCLIRLLRARCLEPIRTGSEPLNAMLAGKRATPTMAGVLWIVAFLVTMLLYGGIDANNVVILLTTLGFAVIGGCDDCTKLFTERRGLSVRQKLIAQTIVASAISVLLYCNQQNTDGLDRWLPIVGNVHTGLWIVPVWMVILVGFSNAVNLTDGLDGLAAGSATIVLFAILCSAYFLLDRAGIALFVAIASLLGGVLGFLCFNNHPARVFMGNVGSLPLGALLGVIGILTGQEVVLMLASLVFVAEAASVLIQVGCFKYSRRRMFLCAPLHHHFQFLGWSELRIVRGFWLAGACAAALAVGVAAWGGKTNKTPGVAIGAPQVPALAAK